MYIASRDLPIKKKLYEKQKQQGICVSCSKIKDTESKSVLCCYCNLMRAKKRHELREMGLCLCGQKKLDNHSSCYDCYFSYITKRLGGRSKKFGFKLKEKFEKQNGQCIYTGKQLILGLNASIDHIIPGKDHSIDNLQFVDRQINSMKTNMSHEEFLDMCNLILEVAHGRIAAN